MVDEEGKKKVCRQPGGSSVVSLVATASVPDAGGLGSWDEGAVSGFGSVVAESEHTVKNNFE